MRKRNPIDASTLPYAEQDRRGAIHEAGHVVVGTTLGLVSDRAELYGPGGLVGQFGLARERPEEMAVALLAGSAAEESVFANHMRQSWSGDLCIVRVGFGWTDAVPKGSEQTNLQRDVILGYWERADDAVDDTWLAILGVADRLQEARRLEGQVLRDIVTEHLVT